MSKLALFGGVAIRNMPFAVSNTIGDEEKAAAMRVLDSGILSDFIGVDGEKFRGGREVLALEAEAAAYVGAKHAISLNSATSALIAAVGACGISPGDEVIVPPYTMSASLAAVLLWGGVPVFADLDPKTFTLCPKAVRAKVTKHTKAIMAVDLFGLPANYSALRDMADAHGLQIVEDAAQAPGAMLEGSKAGALGDIGIYSLNYHKHIHVGEGGVAFTDNDDLAEKMRLIRNHAESVLATRPGADLTNMIGQNYRLTELQAAIANEQFRKLPELLRVRQDYCDRLSARLNALAAFDPPYVPENAEHAYYVYPVLYRRHAGAPHRDAVCKALEAEGIPCRPGYLRPLYELPAFQKRTALGRGGFPFALRPEVDYTNVDCPNVEALQNDELILLLMIHAGLAPEDIDDVASAFEKVEANLQCLNAAAVA